MTTNFKIRDNESRYVLDASGERMVVTYSVGPEHSHRDWLKLNQACAKVQASFPDTKFDFYYDIRPNETARWFYVAISSDQPFGRYAPELTKFAAQMNFGLISGKQTQQHIWSANLNAFQ